jgi:hypothetical protein
MVFILPLKFTRRWRKEQSLDRIVCRIKEELGKANCILSGLKQKCSTDLQTMS